MFKLRKLFQLICVQDGQPGEVLIYLLHDQTGGELTYLVSNKAGGVGPSYCMIVPTENLPTQKV
jgi:hypothetical protein